MPIAERDQALQILGYDSIDSRTIILIINAIYQFVHRSVEETAHVIVAGEGIDLASSAHVGQGWSETAWDSFLHFGEGYGVDLIDEVLVGLTQIVQGFGSFFQSPGSAEIASVDPTFERLLGELEISLWDVSQSSEFSSSNVEDIFGLYCVESTCEAEPETLMPKSPVSE